MQSTLIRKFFAGIDRKLLRRLATALAIGFVGGALFAFLDLPLPWMLGALAACMTASLAGADLVLPQGLRKPMMAVVGVALGSAFTPDRLEGALAWLPSLLTLPIYVAVTGALILFYLRRLSTFDGTTAFFAATPGGLSEMVLLSDSLGGDMRNVALFHSARLVLIVFSIPLLAYIVTGVESASTIAADGQTLAMLDIATLGGLLVIGWLIAKPLRLPSPAFMGPLILSSVVHMFGLTEASPPYMAIAAAQLVIGTSVGSRFSGVPLRLILQTLTLGAGGALLMFAVTLIFCMALYWVTGFPLPLLLLALIPGGFPEMSLIALGMGFDPAFVVTHHGVRVMLVVAFALPIQVWLVRSGWFRRHWPSRAKGEVAVAEASPRSPGDEAPTPPSTADQSGTGASGLSARK